jgi:hypothetical protein
VARSSLTRREEIPVVVAEITDELSKLRVLIGKLKKQHGKLSSEEVVESAALRLHNFYTGSERILKIVAGRIDATVPESEDWHKQLLTQAALSLEEVRPAVVSVDVRRDLEELLGFRHVVRNLYGYELDSERVDRLLGLAVQLFPRLEGDIRAFLDFLRQLHDRT